MTGDDRLVEAIYDDYRKADLDAKTRAVLDFTVQVNKDVHSINAGTIEGLRKQGVSDEDILIVVHVVGFFNYYTRLADALGVDPEPEWGVSDLRPGA